MSVCVVQGNHDFNRSEGNVSFGYAGGKLFQRPGLSDKNAEQVYEGKIRGRSYRGTG